MRNLEIQAMLKKHDATSLPARRLKKSNELLRRVYDAIEMSHLNDFKMIEHYCNGIQFKRRLGEDIFNHLQNDEQFKNTTIKRQKRFRERQKRKNEGSTD